MPIIGWAIYFGIKAMLSLFVGLVALPWKVFSTFKEWRNIKAIKSIVDSGN
jgi:hypothetical protein